MSAPASQTTARHLANSPWREIAVALTQTRSDAVALEFAGAVARQFDARLEVLHLLMMPAPMIDPWAMIPDPSFPQIYEDLRDAARASAATTRKSIAAMGVPGDVRVLEALCVEPSSLAASAARYCDLVVLARPEEGQAEVAVAHSYFATLLHESGRPVLVVPPNNLLPYPPNRALVAWSDTAESARALQAALPLLEKCERVDVLLVDPVANLLEARDDRGTGVLRHLRRHGVAAHLDTCKSRGRSVGEAIMEHARHVSAGLIVAGGYGHGKVREWVIGGTTRDLFFQAQVPVLFAH
ncbi:universal stress protein [Luteibacter yeojuensis]|uniref:Universal stress protein n=1 Tax=Luteibacter yeojuensis TaxID=345309 RepID=A0A7X5QSR4_9GAMM|nr:universal stress protein [Luteibacter yeojuensis]NID14607.1 universal stress protein [Luteibacter yeojuensis]